MSSLPPMSATAMNAVAYQDHWVRTLALGKTFGPRQIGLGPEARAKQKKKVTAVVDTGRAKPKAKPSNEREKEYVLDEKPPPLTLAQKLGLVEAPAPHLSETDWSGVKAKSNARDDSMEPCVICKEDFGLQEQVLLSCSHVFHRACLQAFERYTGRKTCPMCRQEQYQTRVIHEGAKLHRQRCASRIQAAWRGYVVRSWYTNLRKTVPPTDKKLRKKFYIEKLEAITDRMVKSCDFDVNSFLHEIDNSLEQSRDVFRQFDALHRIITDEEWDVIQLKAVERSHQDCPICLTSLASHSDPEGSMDTARPNQGQGDSANKKLPPRSHVAPKASTKPKSRLSAQQKTGKGSPAAEGSTKAGGDGKGGRVGGEVDGQRPRHTVLLSCTHVFHHTCLTTLEELAMGDVRNSCPVCRAGYQKRLITL